MNEHRPTIGVLLDYLGGEYQTALRKAMDRVALERDVNLVYVLGQRLGTPNNAAASARNIIYDLVGPAVVDGMIVVSSTVGNHCGPEGIRRYCQRYAPMPVCSIGLAVAGVPSIVVDNLSGTEAAIAHAADTHGCRRIAYISGPPSSAEAQQRLQGYREALAARSLPYSESLIESGAFTIITGTGAMRRIIERTSFDAVVAANDAMALGALEVLLERGMQVPRDVVVIGFDDVGIARFSRPPLTTVRQPVKQLAGRAIDSVLQRLAGGSVSMCTSTETELVRRASCGCGHPGAGARSARSDDKRELVRALYEAVAIPSGVLQGWPERLLAALEIEIEGGAGEFTRVLSELLDFAEREGATLDEFQSVLSLLRSGSFRADEGELNARLERLWHDSRVLVSAASVRAEGAQRIELENALNELDIGGSLFSTCLSLPLLHNALAEELPRLEIRRAAVSIFNERADNQNLTPLFTIIDGREVTQSQQLFPAKDLAPPGFFDSGVSRSSIVMALSYDVEQLGIVAFDTRANGLVYESLRSQIAAALKGCALHRESVNQTKARERLDREWASEEARVAARIQTSLLPIDTQIAGFEISATMKPAADVGGDYYDVIPTPHGGWIAVGDVAGHGLAAGLEMLMLQSMVGSLVRDNPLHSPSRVVNVLNTVLYDNVRNRLQRDEHATLVLLRIGSGGAVTFAGAHDDFLVYRGRTGRCETISTSGAWVGILPDISEWTRDAELELEDGDLLVLYTDGAIEPRDVHQEQFGLARLATLVESLHERSPVSICERIIEQIENWSATLDDDIALVVARYRA
jgi:DNA-binding LacI/PurR family transcriptional regulator/serine phosphatase RsbU (regulator of sigma subunit)